MRSSTDGLIDEGFLLCLPGSLIRLAQGTKREIGEGMGKEGRRVRTQLCRPLALSFRLSISISRRTFCHILSVFLRPVSNPIFFLSALDEKQATSRTGFER